MRGDKSACKRNNRRMARSKDKGSDESDEDYVVGEEELDDTEDDYCLTFVDDDESEEILGELEEDEDEEDEVVYKQVRKVGRPKVKRSYCVRGRKKIGPMKPKREQIPLYREEEEEEEDDDHEEEDDDDHEVDDEKTNKVAKPRKKMMSYREEHEGPVKPKRKKFPLYREEEDDDDDDGDDDYDEKKANKVAKPRKKKRTSYRKKDDDDFDDADYDYVDEKTNKVVKPRKKKRTSYGEEDDDDFDDADYDYDDEKMNKVAKPRKKKRTSFREEDVDDFGDTDYGYDDEKTNKVAKPRKKERISYREDDDYDGNDDFDDGDYNYDDEKTNVVAEPRQEKTISYGEKDYNCGDEEINKVAQPRKKTRAWYKEEEDDDHTDGDHEFDDESVKLDLRSRERKRSYIEDDDDDDYNASDDKFNDEKKREVAKRKRKWVSYREDDDDVDAVNDDCSSGDEFDDEKVNNVMKPRQKRRVSYKEEDDDYDAVEDRFSDEKASEVAKPRKNKEVLYGEGVGDYICTDDDDEDYDGTDDSDDDEFRPDEDDVLDDEDELLVMNDNKVGGPQIQEKVITRGQKRKSSSKVSKNVRNNPRKKCQPSVGGRSINNGKFLDTKPIVDKNKKVNARRRMTVHSDSDFVSSGPSDYEYTISEDEQELVQEANKFCRSLTTSLRSSNSLKKPEQEKEMLTLRKRPARKGKEKAEDLKVEVGKQVCGICLTEEGKRTVRGTLDCCNHYFCFACIMEWSKVESRCPLCKQRFVTISKPARLGTGFDLRTVVIQVPERDQVYQPSEEELQSLLNPYDHVICTECNEGGDDALMLLCDICDSSAHTYCVGLGCEVPEGNWYCEGCRPAAPGSEVPTPTTDRRTNSDLSVRSPPASEIRASFDLNEMYVPDTPLTQETSRLPSPRPLVGDVQLPSPPTGSGAYTVLERRRIQHQIQQLIYNRRRQMDDRTLETPTTISGLSLFGSQVGRTRELATQPVVAPESMSSNTIYGRGNFQDNTISLLQSYNAPSSGLTHLRGQLSQNQPSTSTYIQNEFPGFNTSNSLRSGHQPLQPCSGRSNIVSDGSRSSCPFGEASVPSRTFREALHSQF